MADKKVVIVGGGLAGLIASIQLTRSGVSCIVVEKKSYPFHRVCGEFISNETVPYLKSLEIYPEEFGPSNIKHFQLTSVNGKSAALTLDLGGFGISRYVFDQFLYEKASLLGVKFLLDTEVEKISFSDNLFELTLSNQDKLLGDVVIGTFGKRSKLDVGLGRSFIQKRSPYVGIKYHVRLRGFPEDLIALHNFQDGYCGISRVEGDTINLCYLTHRNNLKTHGNIKLMEEQVLFQNPFLKQIFTEADFLFDKPETINEISFETKAPLEQHILMAGDAAGMITPLCGNGMAMAIHSAKIASMLVVRFLKEANYTRMNLEEDYSMAWRKGFSRRLWAGRQIQNLFGSVRASNFAVNLANHVKPAANFLVSMTHGKPF